MKQIKNIYVYPKPSEFERELGSDFLFHTNFVTNFVSRHIKTHKLKTDNFDKVCILLSTNPNNSPYISSNSSLMIELLYQKNEEKNIILSNQQESGKYICSLLKKGIAKVEHSYPELFILVTKLVEDFSNQSYKNSWELSKKSLKAKGIELITECSIDIHHFKLVIKCFVDGEMRFVETIVETKPDSLLYDKYLGSLKLVKDEIFVLDKRKNILFNKDLLLLYQ